MSLVSTRPRVGFKMPEALFKRLDHVGIVVHSIDEALKTYRDQLGFELLARVTIAEQLVEAAFLDSGNSTSN